MEDLYPGPDWNYVFGQASLRDRVAVYSFVRYFPEFWGEELSDSTLVMRRSLKVLAHETAHAFGLRHCTAHLCVMNGSNHLEESDSRPLHMCPQDLRKLQWSVGFDVHERYRRLADLYLELGLVDDARWIDRRLEHIGGPSLVSGLLGRPGVPASHAQRGHKGEAGKNVTTLHPRAAASF